MYVFVGLMVLKIIMNLLVTLKYASPKPLGSMFALRSEFLADKTAKSFKLSNNNFGLVKCVPIFKIWGSMIDREEDVYDQSDVSTKFNPKEFYAQIDGFEK